VSDGVVTIPAYGDATHQGAALAPGGPRNYSNANSWYDVVTARSAAGISRDGRTLTLLTVDARGGSEGMRVSEVAALLRSDYGVWNAINLDGGGSTSLATADPATGTTALVNTSSDNPAGRSVATSLVVFALARSEGRADLRRQLFDHRAIGDVVSILGRLERAAEGHGGSMTR